MYDTEKRVAIVKKRIAEHRRRQARRSIRSLFALCVLLFLSGPADRCRRNVRRDPAA